MTDFLLELLSEEIPARMQAKAAADLAKLFADEIAKSGLKAAAIDTFATPRRLALIARSLPLETAAVQEETKGPKVGAPPQALEGFLRKTGLREDQLVERNGVLFAVVDKPGRKTADVLAEAIPTIIRAFPWPKSMRWGTASRTTESLRWVRPLQGIIALLGDDLVPFEIDGIQSGFTTVGHRFHARGPVTIGNAADYAVKLRADHVIIDPEERKNIIRTGATKAAADAGLVLVEDEGLVAENAGLTEWPVPMLGRFDAGFLIVPEEVIQLTARVNQKYFICRDKDGKLANAFICTANIAASDGGAAIVAGNEKVLAARLSDARFFYEQDLKIPLDEQAEKLNDIVFHEKLGTVADKVDRVAKLARWLCEEGIVTPSPLPVNVTASSPLPQAGGVGGGPATTVAMPTPNPSRTREGNVSSVYRNTAVGMTRAELATLAERAARLCKADLVTGMVGEFPELQGVMGGYYAAAQGEAPEVAVAIRDHYKPVGQGDDVPTDPVTVAVSLADKLDTVVSFFAVDEKPTGSKDPFALRRAALGAIALLCTNSLPLNLRKSIDKTVKYIAQPLAEILKSNVKDIEYFTVDAAPVVSSIYNLDESDFAKDVRNHFADEIISLTSNAEKRLFSLRDVLKRHSQDTIASDLISFFADRLKVQQKEAGVRHDLIDAVFALGGEDDLVRLLARVKALQAFVTTPDGTNLLAGYKRAANILKQSPSPLRGEGRGEGEPTSTVGMPTPDPSRMREGERHPADTALLAALDVAEPQARAAVEAEDFASAMAALATLRQPIDAFFDAVMVNDPDPATRAFRLNLLERFRAAVHNVADFSKIEG